MLLLDGEIIKRSELAAKFGVNMDKIAKAPAFEGTNGWKDLANPGKTRYPAGTNVLSRFFVEQGERAMEIRYCETRRKDPKDSDLWIYHPTRIHMEGAGMQLSDDLDKALFCYMHPTNTMSPFFKQGSKSRYEFVDTQKRAERKINDVGALGQAIIHAQTIKGEDARILAKGLGITGLLGKTDEEITAELMNFAATNPAIYLSKKDQRITMIEGQIEHFCDTEIFKLTTIGETRRWSWNAGKKTGEVILDVYNVTINAREALKNHILNDINNYIFELGNISENVSAREKAVKVLEQAGTTKVPDHLAKIGQGGQLPTNFNEAKEYLQAKTGKNQAVTKIGALHKGVVDGSITDENVQDWISENCKVLEEV